MRLADGLVYGGGDYNPEQWTRDTWLEDLELMRVAGVNLVTLGGFSWGLVETERVSPDGARSVISFARSSLAGGPAVAVPAGGVRVMRENPLTDPLTDPPADPPAEPEAASTPSTPRRAS